MPAPWTPRRHHTAAFAAALALGLAGCAGAPAGAPAAAESSTAASRSTTSTTPAPPSAVDRTPAHSTAAAAPSGAVHAEAESASHRGLAIADGDTEFGRASGRGGKGAIAVGDSGRYNLYGVCTGLVAATPEPAGTRAAADDGDAPSRAGIAAAQPSPVTLSDGSGTSFSIPCDGVVSRVQVTGGPTGNLSIAAPAGANWTVVAAQPEGG